MRSDVVWCRANGQLPNDWRRDHVHDVADVSADESPDVDADVDAVSRADDGDKSADVDADARADVADVSADESAHRAAVARAQNRNPNERSDVDADDASDDALRNLATSWGPFQLMGYKCILLDVNIRDIRGPNGVEHGADWINQTYGSVMRQGRFRDCFHMHNTGQPYPRTGLPRTHDPQYVPRGMSMMKQFAPPTAHATP